MLASTWPSYLNLQFAEGPSYRMLNIGFDNIWICYIWVFRLNNECVTLVSQNTADVPACILEYLPRSYEVPV
jgi:hypothetical protein